MEGGEIQAMTDKKPFWKLKSLKEMSQKEWESLCDHCGKCCLVQLEDEDGRREFTDVACRLYDVCEGGCRNYAHRSREVPDCVRLTPGNIGELHFMPMTCAYRLLNEGKDLPDWHPLVSGDPDSVREAGMSVVGQVVPEADVPDWRLEHHIRLWPGESGD